MEKRECVLSLDGWERHTINADRDELIQFGPSLPISISAHGGAAIATIAQIDTGASHSCLSPALAMQLGAPIGFRLQHPAGGEPKNVPVHHCTISFSNGTEIDADFAILAGLAEPHSVLIGRDLLSYCRLVVDFTSNGRWELHIKLL